jgi:hypothetical protein
MKKWHRTYKALQLKPSLDGVPGRGAVAYVVGLYLDDPFGDIKFTDLSLPRQAPCHRRQENQSCAHNATHLFDHSSFNAKSDA